MFHVDIRLFVEFKMHFSHAFAKCGKKTLLFGMQWQNAQIDVCGIDEIIGCEGQGEQVRVVCHQVQAAG